MVREQRDQTRLRLGLRRALREAPNVASPGVLRRTTGTLYTYGGLLLALAAHYLVMTPSAHRTIVVAAWLSVLVGVLVLTFGERLRRWAYHVLSAMGTGIITFEVLLVHDGPGGIALSSLYLFVIVNAIFMFPLWQGVLHVLVAETACGVSLTVVGLSFGEVVMVQGCSIGTAVVAAWLARAANAAEKDPLTLLLNRRGFDRRLQDDIRHAAREGTPLSLAALDIDYFKQVNDEGGHVAGDSLLLECARAWSALLPDGACLARYGGDEFAVLLPGMPLGSAADLVDELRSATPDDFTVSAGVASWSPADSGSILMNRADVALYDAKTSGRDRTVAYGDPGRAASELESAITRGELRLAYQPIVRIPTGEVVGFEALARWHHPQKGLVPPDDFIPQAERTGAIRSLGRWVLESVCRTVMTEPEPRRSVGVNVSASELRTPDYAATVAGLLETWSMPGDLLVIEVTEGAFDDGDEQVMENLCALRELGVLVAIDDFGAGHSSLRRLAQLPIDIIKLDGALVATISDDSDDAPILDAIVNMGRGLGVNLVAEKVETAHQADVLQRLGYELAQGYHFGRPGPREEVVAVAAGLGDGR